MPLDVAVAEVFEEALQCCFQFVGPVPAKGGVGAPAHPLSQASGGGVASKAERTCSQYR